MTRKIKPKGQNPLLSRTPLRFRAVDGSKTFVRLFQSVKRKQGESTVLTPSVLRNRVWAAALEKLYGGKAELEVEPATRLPPFNSSA